MPVQYDREGRPISPEFGSIIDPNTGRLASQFTLSTPEALSPWAEGELSKINLNTDALNKLRGIGLETGDSAWAKMMLEKQRQEEAQARDEARGAADREAANAWDLMAMKGGASGGQRERAAMNAAAGGRNAVANVNRQGSLDRLNIGLQDDQRRMDVLKSLPGMEIQALSPSMQKLEMLGRAKESDIARKSNVEQFNLGNLINDTRGKNDYELARYQEAMKAWASNKTADAQKEASEGGGISYICSEVGKVVKLSKKEKALLGRLREYSLDHLPEKAEFYFLKCQNLVTKMKCMGVNFREYYPFVKTVILYIEEYGVAYAADYYWQYLNQIVDLYAPELKKPKLTLLKEESQCAL